jgi:hypothetical protein
MPPDRVGANGSDLSAYTNWCDPALSANGSETMEPDDWGARSWRQLFQHVAVTFVPIVACIGFTMRGRRRPVACLCDVCDSILAYQQASWKTGMGEETKKSLLGKIAMLLPEPDRSAESSFFPSSCKFVDLFSGILMIACFCRLGHVLYRSFGMFVLESISESSTVRDLKHIPEHDEEHGPSGWLWDTGKKKPGCKIKLHATCELQVLVIRCITLDAVAFKVKEQTTRRTEVGTEASLSPTDPTDIAFTAKYEEETITDTNYARRVVKTQTVFLGNPWKLKDTEIPVGGVEVQVVQPDDDDALIATFFFPKGSKNPTYVFMPNGRRLKSSIKKGVYDAFDEFYKSCVQTCERSKNVFFLALQSLIGLLVAIIFFPRASSMIVDVVTSLKTCWRDIVAS